MINKRKTVWAMILLAGMGLNANSIEKLDIECNQGDFQKCTTLGILYSKGEVVKKDISKTIDYYTKACNGDNLDGCANLGYFYLTGTEVKQDFKKAVEIYTKTCNSEKKLGCTNLGLLYSKGNGVEKNPKKAVYFYDRACSAGDVVGCYNVAGNFREGRGVKKNISIARDLYKISCDGGYAFACHNLAIIYHIGADSINIDTQKALLLYDKACKLKFDEGCYSYNILKQKPDVTCDNLDKLGWYYVGANFKRRCSKFGVDVNIEQVKNMFLSKNSEFPEKREKIINLCKQKCKDNKECIEKMSIGMQQIGNKMAKERLQNRKGCQSLNDFLNSKR